MIAELFQRTIDMNGRLLGAVPGCWKDGKTTDPPARSSASTNAWSDAASDGVEKSTSNTTSCTPELSSRRSSSAWSRRGQGQTPIFSIEGASIATTTIVAAGLTRFPGEPQIGQCIAERAVPAGQQNDRQRERHEDMWPVMFQGIPIPHTSQPARCALHDRQPFE